MSWAWPVRGRWGYSTGAQGFRVMTVPLSLEVSPFSSSSVLLAVASLHVPGDLTSCLRTQSLVTHEDR